MKRIYGILGSILLLLALLAPGASAGGTFAFRNGVTWDTTEAEMLAAEGLAEGGAYNRNEDNGFVFFYLGSHGGAEVYYVLRDDLPVMAYTVQPGGAYAGALETMTASWGATADVSADTVSALINATRGPGAVLPEDLTNLAAWRLSDGTLAALFMIGGKTYTAYFNERRF